MKKIYSLLMIAVFLLCSCSDDDDNGQPTTVTDDNGQPTTVTMELNGLLSSGDSLYISTAENGEEFTDSYGNILYKSTFSDKTHRFECLNYTANWGTGPVLGGGFTYTNAHDTVTYNSIAAITGKGVKGDTYLTANVNGIYPTIMSIDAKEGCIIKSAYFTNATYAYRSMLNGDSYAKKFVEGDWFKLTITAKIDSIVTKTQDIYLADFRNGKKEILKEWKEIDLSGLGKVNNLSFELSSSDNSQYGMNTPAYFCMDAVTAEF